jgi:hypothetical protein
MMLQLGETFRIHATDRAFRDAVKNAYPIKIQTDPVDGKPVYVANGLAEHCRAAAHYYDGFRDCIRHVSEQE